MWCWHFKIKLSKSLDENTQLAGQVKDHLKQCPRCKSFYEVSHALRHAFSGGFEPDMESIGRVRRFAGKSINSGTVQRRRFASACLVFAASAAGIILLVMPVFYFKPEPQKNQPQYAHRPLGIQGLAQMLQTSLKQNDYSAISKISGYSTKAQLAGLAQSGQRATDFLIASLDPGLLFEGSLTAADSGGNGKE